MRTVMVRLPAVRFSAAMAAMREWLDRKGYEPAKFTYDQNDEAVVVSVTFLEDQEGDAFARHFAGEERHPTTPLELEFLITPLDEP